MRKHGDLRGEHQIGEATQAIFFAQFTLYLVNFVFSVFFFYYYYLRARPLLLLLSQQFYSRVLLSDDGYQTIL